MTNIDSRVPRDDREVKIITARYRYWRILRCVKRILAAALSKGAVH